MARRVPHSHTFLTATNYAVLTLLLLLLPHDNGLEGRQPRWKKQREACAVLDSRWPSVVRCSLCPTSSLCSLSHGRWMQWGGGHRASDRVFASGARPGHWTLEQRQARQARRARMIGLDGWMDSRSGEHGGWRRHERERERGRDQGGRARPSYPAPRSCTRDRRALSSTTTHRGRSSTTASFCGQHSARKHIQPIMSEHPGAYVDRKRKEHAHIADSEHAPGRCWASDDGRSSRLPSCYTLRLHDGRPLCRGRHNRLRQDAQRAVARGGCRRGCRVRAGRLPHPRGVQLRLRDLHGRLGAAARQLGAAAAQGTCPCRLDGDVDTGAGVLRQKGVCCWGLGPGPAAALASFFTQASELTWVLSCALPPPPLACRCTTSAEGVDDRSPEIIKANADAPSRRRTMPKFQSAHSHVYHHDLLPPCALCMFCAFLTWCHSKQIDLRLLGLPSYGPPGALHFRNASTVAKCRFCVLYSMFVCRDQRHTLPSAFCAWLVCLGLLCSSCIPVSPFPLTDLHVRFWCAWKEKDAPPPLPHPHNMNCACVCVFLVRLNRLSAIDGCSTPPQQQTNLARPQHPPAWLG